MVDQSSSCALPTILVLPSGTSDGGVFDAPIISGLLSSGLGPVSELSSIVRGVTSLVDLVTGFSRSNGLEGRIP